MKITINKTATAFVLFISVYILGCTKETGLVSNNQKRISTNAQSNGATAFTTSAKINVSITVFIPCANNGNGETVTLNGTLHETYHVTVNNNNFQMKIIDHPQGISGIGDVTGNKYQATGETEQQTGGSFINGQFEGNFVNNFKIIGQGPGNNFLVHETAHITVNANGTVTSSLDHAYADCK